LVELIYLAPDESPPEQSDEDRWLYIDANDEGGFYGTGWSRKTSGESVFYRSLSEDDATLELAIAAATAWAEKYSVPKIWIQREPWNLDAA
jgi:hypothetical protein